MAKYKPHDYGQTVLLPIDYSRQLLPGTFEHILNYLVDHKIDLGIFAKRYKNDDTGAPAWDPAVMLKIIFNSHKLTLPTTLLIKILINSYEELIIFLYYCIQLMHWKPAIDVSAL